MQKRIGFSKINSFSNLYVLILGTFITGGLLTSLIASSYLGLRIMEAISFKSSDDWCNPIESGIGNHCFGDFQLPMILVKESNPWILGHSYPPISMLPNIIFNFLKNEILGPEFSLYFYICLQVIAICFPLFIALEKYDFAIRIILTFFLSIFTLASLNSLDRGTSAIFAVPFLFLAAKNYLTLNSKNLLIWTIIAGFIRPQFIFIALFLLAMKEYKKFFLSIAIFISSIAVGFALWPGDRILHVKSWFNTTSNYDSYAQSTANWPINISAGKSLSRILSYLTEKFPNHEIFNYLNSWTLNNFKIFGILIGLLIFALTFGGQISKSIIVVAVLLGPAVIPGVSWSYYLMVLIPISALLISSTIEGVGLLDESNLNIFAKFHIIFTVALVLSPFALPTASDPMNTALMGQFWGPLLLLLLGHLIAAGYWQGLSKTFKSKGTFAKNPANPV